MTKEQPKLYWSILLGYFLLGILIVALVLTTISKFIIQSAWNEDFRELTSYNPQLERPPFYAIDLKENRLAKAEAERLSKLPSILDLTDRKSLFNFDLDQISEMDNQEFNRAKIEFKDRYKEHRDWIKLLDQLKEHWNSSCEIFVTMILSCDDFKLRFKAILLLKDHGTNTRMLQWALEGAAGKESRLLKEAVKAIQSRNTQYQGGVSFTREVGQLSNPQVEHGLSITQSED